MLSQSIEGPLDIFSLEENLEEERSLDQWLARRLHSQESAYVPLNAPLFNIAIQGVQVASYFPPAYSQTLAAVQAELDEIRSQISGLAKPLQALERLHDQPATRTLAIHGLRSKKYSLRKPLFVMLEDYPGEIVARLPEFDLYASEENEADAIASLQQEIVRLYEDLRESEAELGGLPASWLRDLGDYIEERVLKNG